MQIGRVVGTLVSTQKNAKLVGSKLLLVQPITPDGLPRGAAVLAIDSVGAGVGELVLIVLEGRAAGEAMRVKAAPVDAAIVGIVETIDCKPDGASTPETVPAEVPQVALTGGTPPPDTTGHARRRTSRPRT